MAHHLSSSRLLDLTHNVTETMPTWRLGEGFSKRETATVAMDGVWRHEYTFKKGGIGTHFDSAGHFALGKRAVHEYTVDDLIAPLVVIDVRQQIEQQGRDYQLQVSDIHQFEKVNGRIRDDSVILIDQGYTALWATPEQHVGFDDKGVRHFPSFGLEAAKFLDVERRCRAVAADVLSIDAGSNLEMSVHKQILGSNKWALECVKVVDGLPAVGATIIASPIKIENGSEAACRVYAAV